MQNIKPGAPALILTLFMLSCGTADPQPLRQDHGGPSPAGTDTIIPEDSLQNENGAPNSADQQTGSGNRPSPQTPVPGEVISGEIPSPPAPPTTPPPGDPSEEVSCDSGGTGGATGEGVDVSSDGVRATAWIPDNAGPVPLIISFHGMGSNGAYQLANYPLQKHYDSKNVMVVVTNGGAYQSRWAWQPNADTKQLSTFLESLMKKYPIDRQRVYLFGHSAGGFHAFNFACSNPGVIAAVAADGGGWLGFDQKTASCDPGLSVLFGFGANDVNSMGNLPRMYETFKTSHCSDVAEEESSGDWHAMAKIKEQRGCGGRADKFNALWLVGGWSHFGSKAAAMEPMLDAFLETKTASCPKAFNAGTVNSFR